MSVVVCKSFLRSPLSEFPSSPESRSEVRSRKQNSARRARGGGGALKGVGGLQNNGSRLAYWNSPWPPGSPCLLTVRARPRARDSRLSAQAPRRRGGPQRPRPLPPKTHSASKGRGSRLIQRLGPKAVRETLSGKHKGRVKLRVSPPYTLTNLSKQPCSWSQIPRPGTEDALRVL